MAKFKYRAMSGNGKKIEGNHVANSRDEVVQMITSNGYYPLMIEEVVESTNIELGFGEKVTTKDIAIFCRQLYTMIDAGVSINRSLNIMANQLTNKKLRKVTSEIEEDVKKGEMLSAAIKKNDDVFPQLLISMVESGEISGNLDTMMLRMSTHFEKENKLNNKIKAAMTYPTILGIVAVCAVMFIMTFVMPTFIEMFESEGVVLPITTKILINISAILQKNFLFIIVCIICATV